MCVPSSPPINMAPQPVPSMQAADNLQLGGDAGNRGASLLGRLMLRTGGTSSAADSSTASPAGAAQASIAQAKSPAANITGSLPSLASLQIGGAFKAPIGAIGPVGLNRQI